MFLSYRFSRRSITFLLLLAYSYSACTPALAVVGNITVSTQELRNKEWDESSSSYRGIVKDLVKGVSFAVSAITLGAVNGEIKVGVPSRRPIEF